MVTVEELRLVDVKRTASNSVMTVDELLKLDDFFFTFTTHLES